MVIAVECFQVSAFFLISRMKLQGHHIASKTTFKENYFERTKKVAKIVQRIHLCPLSRLFCHFLKNHPLSIFFLNLLKAAYVCHAP